MHKIDRIRGKDFLFIIECPHLVNKNCVQLNFSFKVKQLVYTTTLYFNHSL